MFVIGHMTKEIKLTASAIIK